MGLVIEIKDIEFENNFEIWYSTGRTPGSVSSYSSETWGTQYSGLTGGIFSGGTETISIGIEDEVENPFNTQFWFKLRDVVTGNFIIENIYIHDFTFYEGCIPINCEFSGTSEYYTETPVSLTDTDILLVDGDTNFVHKYDPTLNIITYLFSGQTSNPVSDIATTTNRIFLNYQSGDIEVYSYVSSPFSATYLNTVSFPLYVGNGLCAIDNNNLLVGADNVYSLDLSGATGTTLFSLPVDCFCTGDIVYNPTLDQYLVSYTNGATYESFVSIYDNTYTAISTIDLTPYTDPTYPDTFNMFGLYSYISPSEFPSIGKIYGMTNELYIYELDFSNQSISIPIQPSNLTTEKCIGTSIATFNVNWNNPAPTFFYT